jgi:hypothetical protein
MGEAAMIWLNGVMDKYDLVLTQQIAQNGDSEDEDTTDATPQDA